MAYCTAGEKDKGELMKYIVRLNLKAFNPLTKQMIASRLWEVEQCESIGGNGQVDSAKYVMHCADVRIDAIPIRMLFKLPKLGEKPWEQEFYGVCVRGQDNAVEIHTRGKNVSGNKN